MKTITAFAVCVCAWGQVDRPQVGKMLDANGALRTIYGIASSVTAGDVEASGVLSAGCGKSFCLVKTEAAIVSNVGSVEAPAGPALFAFDGDAVFVWFSRVGQLARWHDGVLDVCPLPDGRGSGGAEVGDAEVGAEMGAGVDAEVGAGVDAGRVLSIGVSGGAVQFAVRRRSGVWIINQDGSIAGSLPRATGPVMLTPGGVVYATRSEIVVGDVRLPIEGVTSFSWMLEHYLQVRAGGVDYSLRVEAGRVTLFQLPGGSQ